MEEADGGTAFLDEIGELPLGVQAKMLRFLENGEIRRVGSNRTKRIDVRILTATNRDLGAYIKEGRFRDDLFFRLEGVTLTIPPLRERKEDIGPLAELFVEAVAREAGRAPPALAPAARRALEQERWPGNARELKRRIELALLHCAGTRRSESSTSTCPRPRAKPSTGWLPGDHRAAGRRRLARARPADTRGESVAR